MGYELSPESKQFLAIQILSQDEDKLKEGKYTLVFTEYTREQLAELHKYSEERYQIRAERTRSWANCPSCGRMVLEKELTKKGCYLCGWRGKKEEIESGEMENCCRVEQADTLDEMEKIRSYRTECPECGARLIREQVIEKGCFICGWKLK